MKREIYELVKLLYDVVCEDCKYVFIGGSYCSKLFSTSHDIDVIFVFEDKDTKIQGYRKMKKVENVLQILQSTYNTVVIPVTLEHIQKLKVYSYLYKYYDNLDWFLFGSMEEFNKNIPDILENRENYLTILKDTLDWVLKYQEKHLLIPKGLYHVLTGIYIIKNNSYNLSEVEIQNINICHSYNQNEEKQKLLDYCKSYLNEK